jgi:hypothetical protein
MSCPTCTLLPDLVEDSGEKLGEDFENEKAFDSHVDLERGSFTARLCVPVESNDDLAISHAAA